MNHNSSIGCKVTECSYHCMEDMYCTLPKIEITKHEPTAMSAECTDCASFKKR